MASYNITVNENVALGRSILTLLRSAPQAVTFEMPKEREKTLGNFAGLLSESESRKGWAKAAKEFVESGNEETFFSDIFEDENLNWWQWKQQ